MIERLYDETGECQLTPTGRFSLDDPISSFVDLLGAAASTHLSHNHNCQIPAKDLQDDSYMKMSLASQLDSLC